MRVLFWSELFWPYIGGAEVFAAKLIRSLSQRGVEIRVVTSHDTCELPDLDQFDGVPVHRLPFRAVASGRAPGRLREVLTEVARLKTQFRPDLVHINAVGPSTVFHLQTLGKDRVPTLVTLQQEVLPNQTAGGTLLMRLLMAVDRVVAVSNAVLAQARRSLPVIEPKSCCIYNGVEEPLVDPAPLPWHPPTLLYLGRLVPAKRVEVVLAAMARLLIRHPQLRLLIAGDGPLRETLEARARELGIAHRVEFLGWVNPDDVYTVINSATCVLMPSLREGLPLVAVQAALMGRPIVASAVGGLVEVILDQHTGALVDPDDFEGFVSAVARVLEDPERATCQGMAGRAHARKTFDWEQTVLRYHEVYRGIAGG